MSVLGSKLPPAEQMAGSKSFVAAAAHHTFPPIGQGEKRPPMVRESSGWHLNANAQPQGQTPNPGLSLA